mgnify:CR=1 FL=1
MLENCCFFFIYDLAKKTRQTDEKNAENHAKTSVTNFTKIPSNKFKTSK